MMLWRGWPRQQWELWVPPAGACNLRYITRIAQPCTLALFFYQDGEKSTGPIRLLTLLPDLPPSLPAVVPGTPVQDVKLLVETVSSLVRSNALRTGKGINVSFGSKSNEEKLVVG